MSTFLRLQLKSTAGFTLVELMMTCLIFSILIGGVTLAISNQMQSLGTFNLSQKYLSNAILPVEVMRKDVKLAWNINVGADALGHPTLLLNIKEHVGTQIQDRVIQYELEDHVTPECPGCKNLIRKMGVIKDDPGATVLKFKDLLEASWCLHTATATCPAGVDKPSTPSDRRFIAQFDVPTLSKNFMANPAYRKKVSFIAEVENKPLAWGATNMSPILRK